MVTQMTSQPRSSDLARRTLFSNAVFSGGSGLLLLFAATPIAAWMGVMAPLALTVIGALLVGYAALLYGTASRERINPRFVILFTIMDTLWVVASVVILLTGWPALSSAGKWTVAIVADIVSLFAFLQFLAVRRTSQTEE